MTARSVGSRNADLALILAAAGTVGLVAGRLRSRGRDRGQSFIQWSLGGTMATALARTGKREAITPALSQHYRELSQQSVQEVRDYLSQPQASFAENAHAIDRVAWVRLNLGNYRRLVKPLDRALYELSESSGSLGHSMALAAGPITALELGGLLGMLSHRVLAQYDFVPADQLADRQPSILFLHGNINTAAARLGVEPLQFQHWIALHEVTHAYQFEDNPWVPDHFELLITGYLTSIVDELTQMRSNRQLTRALLQRMRERPRGRFLLETLMSPRQREAFREIQAFMSLNEGYSTFLMNAVGRTVIADFEQIHARFSARQANENLFGRLLATLTGLSIKREQYRAGEAFVETVVREAGLRAMQVAWAAPQNLPTLDEIYRPADWLHRLELR